MANNKLDFLMKLTNSRNTVLARAVSFDTSYISRMRSGSRSIPRKKTFVHMLSSYFAKNIRYEYQKKTLSDMICQGTSWPDDTDMAEELIFQWLISAGGDAALNDPDMSGDYQTESGINSAETDDEHTNNPRSDARIYYGTAEKRKAFLLFLEDLLMQSSAGQLLMYSDEDMGWLEESDAYMQQCTGLLLSLFARGWKMKMIHTITRNSGDMMIGVHKWVPLYMSAAIEPYYYPKLRDGIYHRSLFVARGHSALTSTSIGELTDNAMNILLFEPVAVKALEEEFEEYSKRCRPLANIYNISISDRFMHAMDAHNRREGNWTLASSIPSDMSLPANVAETIGARAGSLFSKCQHDRSEHFRQCLDSGYIVTELLNLPDIHSLSGECGPMIPMPDLYGKSDISYTRQEFIEHLENVQKLMMSYDNYRVILNSEISRTALISIIDDSECFLIRASSPTLAFGITEPRLVLAFSSFLDTVIESSTGSDTNNTLENYIHLLKS